MSFFEPPPPPRPESKEPGREPWMGPPEDVLGGLVPIQFVLARSEKAAVAVDGIAPHERYIHAARVLSPG